MSCRSNGAASLLVCGTCDALHAGGLCSNPFLGVSLVRRSPVCRDLG